MSPAVAVALWWLGFAGSHVVLSSVSVRRQIVAVTGESLFRGLYSLVAFAFFVPLVATYFAHKHAGPWLWAVPRGSALRGVLYVGMGVAFVFVVASLLRPSPSAIVPGDPTPRGVYRLTRHPLLMGLGVFGLVHLLANGSAADVAFFGGFPLFAIVGAWHQDARKLASGDRAFAAFHAATPLLPFTGRETARGLREFSPVALALGLLAAVVVRYFHGAWFGP